jgi:ribosomal protein S14
LIHSKSIEDISTITWRCKRQEGFQKEMNLCRELVRKHEEENGSMHGFECKGDGA